MSAFINLITFAAKLDGELLADFQQRVNAYMDEKYSIQNERIATSQANTGTFEVVAIAGTADTLLSNPHQTVQGC
jgi:DNA/RNA endonuclease YhcR with UshA esterase domain